MIEEFATKLGDQTILYRISQNPSGFSYHSQNKTKLIKNPKQCYSTLKLRASRCMSEPPPEEPVADDTKDVDITDDSEMKIYNLRGRKSTKSRSGHDDDMIKEEPASKKKKAEPKCIICTKRTKGRWPNEESQVYRISIKKTGKSRASRFLSAAKYNDDHVSTECVFLKTVGDVFAADIYYHGSCIKGYLNDYERKMEKVLKNISREEIEAADVDGIDGILHDNFDFNCYGYSLTDITNKINECLNERFDNRKTKAALITAYGNQLGFSYSDDQSQPQIVFGRSVEISDVIEGSLRKADPLKDCANILKSELSQHGFNLETSLCLSSDLALASQIFKDNRPSEWLRFISYLFPGRKKESEWLLRFDTLYQIIWNWVFKKTTPMHVGVTEMIHCLTKSKELIDTFNRMGFCMSYDAMKRVDVGIADSIIASAGINRCPLSDAIISDHPIQAAVDNFNHQERTNSGIEVSNDTVLVIFQNRELTRDKRSEMSKLCTELKSKDRRRTLETTLACQELLKSGLYKKTGAIPDSFNAILNVETRKELSDQVDEDHFLWWYFRNIFHLRERAVEGEHFIPSFTAINSKLDRGSSGRNGDITITEKSFIPILPYPATSMDSIYTSMVNFCDVLRQRGEEYGALWSDEGVYCIAKEIQFLRPEEFGHLFLGLGPFHWCRIVIAGIGSFLSTSGITEALVNSGVYGKGVAESSVMKGTDYVKGKEGMTIIAEAMTALQYTEFKKSEQFKILFHHDSLETDLESLHQELRTAKSNLYSTKEDMGDKDIADNRSSMFIQSWEKSKITTSTLMKHFKEFQDSNEGNENFSYWNIFLHQMYPALRDFELSVRKGDWHLFMSAVRRCIPIFFATGRTNYSRWGTIFYQDALDLQRKFPELLKHYIDGGFVCYMSERATSGIGFDQALEKCYNFTSKAVGGIIGVTRQKKSVALWDVIKHEKDRFVGQMKDVVNIEQHQHSELGSLHHEYSNRSARQSQDRTFLLTDYITSIKSPFSSQCSDKLINIVTKQELQNTEYLLNSISFGEKLYDEFITHRLDEKSVDLHATISKKYYSIYPDSLALVQGAKKKKVTVLTDEVENTRAVNYIKYAISRGKTIEYMLEYPILSRPVFLLEKNSINLKKTGKSELTNMLLCKLDNETIITDVDGKCPQVESDAILVDFMSVTRKLSSVELKDISTFGELCQALLRCVMSYSHKSKEVHLILENYKELSPKSSERLRRAGAAGIPCKVLTDNQPLPKDLKDFFSLTDNKKSFQNFFVGYCIKHYKATKHLYIAGGLTSDPDKCMVISGGEANESASYRASHEEADDRIMFSVNQLFTKKVEKITIVTPDADIFVVLMYHLKNTWKGMCLYLLKKGQITVRQRAQWELYPLHLLIPKIEPNVIDQLPAGHALTGCDTGEP